MLHRRGAVAACLLATAMVFGGITARSMRHVATQVVAVSPAGPISDAADAVVPGPADLFDVIPLPELPSGGGGGGDLGDLPVPDGLAGSLPFVPGLEDAAGAASQPTVIVNGCRYLAVEYAFAREINHARTARGLPALQVDRQLSRVSDAHSREM